MPRNYQEWLTYPSPLSKDFSGIPEIRKTRNLEYDIISSDEIIYNVSKYFQLPPSLEQLLAYPQLEQYASGIVWSPEGEWTGYFVDHFLARFRNESRFSFSNARFRSTYIGDRRYLDKHVYSFEEYSDQVSWGLQGISGSHRENLASLINGEKAATRFGLITLNSGYISDWIEALRSGWYSEGIGYLRDGDDNYDILGVLADINEVEWEYSEKEDAYQFGEGFNSVNHSTLNKWLGIPGNVQEKTVLEGFTNWIYELADSSKDFASTIRVLDYFMRRRKQLMKGWTI